jgi:hypothetical protein
VELATGPGLLPGLLEPLTGTTGASPYRQVGQRWQCRALGAGTRGIYRSWRARYRSGFAARECRRSVDVQTAARHAEPRTTMRYDRARKNLDRHPNYILAAYMASGT